MNKILELQKMLVIVINDIEYLQQNGIKCFISVPNKIRMPYIKLINIEQDMNKHDCAMYHYFIGFFVATNGKNNGQILEIMEHLSNNLNDTTINNTVLKFKSDLSVFHVYNHKYSVSEDLQNNTWYGHFYIDIDIARTS